MNGANGSGMRCCFQVSFRPFVQTHPLVRVFKLLLVMFQPPRFVAAFMKEQESALAASLGHGVSPPLRPSSMIPPLASSIGMNFAPSIAPLFPGGVNQPMPAATAPSIGDHCFIILEAEATKEQTTNRDLLDDEQRAFLMQTCMKNS